MKQADFEKFLNVKLGDRLVDLRKIISDDIDEQFEPLNKQVIDVMKTWQDGALEYIENVKPLISQVADLTGLQLGRHNSISILTDMSPINDFYTMKNVGISYKESDLFVDEVTDYFKRQYIKYIHKASQEAIEAKKEISAINVEFDNVKYNIKSMGGSQKKKIEMLVNIGFDKDEILSYDSSSTAVVLASVDKSKIFG